MNIHADRLSILLVSTLLLTLPAQQPDLPPVASAMPADIGGCPMFPADSVWNTRIDSLPVDARSSSYIASIGASTGLHPDFGANWDGGPFGIPYTTVPGAQPLVGVTFDYADESDPGPYPIPPDAPVEGGSDRHVLVVDRDHCTLYEMWNAWKQADGSWQAGSGAVFDLQSNALRPDTWTSADAAGLPILPGLVRYDEVAAGEIKHAIRFTVQHTRNAHIWPARHDASSNADLNLPPMGQRFRLKASKDISGYPAQIQVIFTAFKRYGLILADNGSNWYVSGAPDARWDDDMLVTAFRSLKGSDFEAVDESSLMVHRDSGQAAAPNSFALSVAPAWRAIAPGSASTHAVSAQPLGGATGVVTFTTSSPSGALQVSLSPPTAALPAQATLVLTDTHIGPTLMPGVWYNVPVTATTGVYTQVVNVGLLAGGGRVYAPLIRR
jgi:hypothetical protein